MSTDISVDIRAAPKHQLLVLLACLANGPCTFLPSEKERHRGGASGRKLKEYDMGMVRTRSHTGRPHLNDSLQCDGNRKIMEKLECKQIEIKVLVHT